MKTLEKHEKYMLRCIYLARNNESKYYPNPSVGSIIVKDNIIISEGTRPITEKITQKSMQ